MKTLGAWPAVAQETKPGASLMSAPPVLCTGGTAPVRPELLGAQTPSAGTTQAPLSLCSTARIRQVLNPPAQGWMLSSKHEVSSLLGLEGGGPLWSTCGRWLSGAQLLALTLRLQGRLNST